MSTTSKTKIRKIKPLLRKLLFCLCGLLLIAAVFFALIFLRPATRDSLPVFNHLGKVYTCGEPYKQTATKYFLMTYTDSSIVTQTIDGEETLAGFSIRKDWPDSPGNKLVSIGGLRLGDSEEKLLKNYPQADTDGLRITTGIYNPDETWEHFTVYYYDGKTYSPSEYSALLESVSESDADMIQIRSYALVVMTIQDEIDCVVFGNYTGLIHPLTQAMDGTVPYC